VRSVSPKLQEDRSLATDIQLLEKMIERKQFAAILKGLRE
jgi:histidine ammonia-lyase